MAGCKCAGRSKRSASMQAYKNGNRCQVNKDKNIARAKKSVPKNMTTPRGTARKIRREAWMAANSGISFNKWENEHAQS